MNKKDLFLSSLVAAIFIHLREKELCDRKEDVNSFFSDNKAKSDVLDRVRHEPYFLEILDKRRILDECKERIINSFINNALSETVLFESYN